MAGKGYVEHCAGAIKELLAQLPDGEVLFVPYAAVPDSWDAYAQTAEQFFSRHGQPFRSIHTCDEPASYIEGTRPKLLFIGGGNTFLLAKTLQDKELYEPIRRVIQDGTGYMGTSAGSNIACPTIQTTNDMPIVEPQSFEALRLVNFQINPHFVPGSLVEGHKGETREQRIAEYQYLNDRIVVGLPELSWISVDDATATLGGEASAVVFEPGKPQREWSVGSMLE